MLQKTKQQKRGFTLLELLLGIAIFSSGALSVTYLIVEAVKAVDLNNRKIQTTFFAKEGLEAVRAIRDGEGFSTLLANLGSNGLSFNSGTEDWEFSSTSDEPADDYLRVVQLEDEGDLVKVTSTASVEGYGRTISTSLVSYLSDWR